eukprot:TRINITY_DN4819_c0_g2_i1.p2 TRINITY_DN4819_c0_g2~~TRINITY_DN4819_c0_g2_i1.p2  ORF type:complete len:127 (+),score=22.97 TRINITY_DN4819_c0_g2_i1:68-448(+)
MSLVRSSLTMMRPRMAMARPLVRRMGAAAHEEPQDPKAYEKAVAAQKPAGGRREWRSDGAWWRSFEDWELISYIGFFGTFTYTGVMLFKTHESNPSITQWAETELALRKAERKAEQEAAAKGNSDN